MSRGETVATAIAVVLAVYAAVQTPAESAVFIAGAAVSWACARH